MNEKKKVGQVLLQCLHQFLFEYWKVAQKMVEEQKKRNKIKQVKKTDGCFVRYQFISGIAHILPY